MPSYTPEHSERVGKIADALLEIFNQNNCWKKYVEENNRRRYIELGIKLHDIGKICIDNSILYRNGDLLSHQRQLMQKHTEHGEAMLDQLPWKDEIIHMVRYHHSFSKGSSTLPKLDEGKLAEAYLVAIADNIDALTTKRPYPGYYKKDGEKICLKDKEVFSIKDAIYIIYNDMLIHVSWYNLKMNMLEMLNKNKELFAEKIKRDGDNKENGYELSNI